MVLWFYRSTARIRDCRSHDEGSIPSRTAKQNGRVMKWQPQQFAKLPSERAWEFNPPLFRQSVFKIARMLLVIDLLFKSNLNLQQSLCGCYLKKYLCIVSQAVRHSTFNRGIERFESFTMHQIMRCQTVGVAGKTVNLLLKRLGWLNSITTHQIS